MTILRDKIKVGDTVLIEKGKDAPKAGKVAKVGNSGERIIVEGLNQYKKHIKPSKKYPQGGIIDLSAPIFASNLRVICPSCKAATRVGFKNEGRDKRRVCKKCSEVIDAVKK